MAYIPYNSGQFNTTPTYPSNGGLVPLQVDDLGNLKTTEQGPTVPDLLMRILGEVRATRRILATAMQESGQARDSDFNPINFAGADDLDSVVSES